MSLVRSARLRHSMALAIVATMCAAGLVLYLQHRAISALESQNAIILRHISQQAAQDIAEQVRRTLEGPVFNTLSRVNHPDLRAGRLDLVAREFDEGLRLYPQVERFVVWTADTETVTPGEALFQGRAPSSDLVLPRVAKGVRFSRDAELGRAIVALARRHVGDQHIYIAADEIGPGGHHVFLRLFWADARRVEYFAVLGFVVEPREMGTPLVATLHERGLGALLNRPGGGPPLQLRVTDQHGALVYGSASPLATAATVTVPMQFFPTERVATRLFSLVAPRSWRIEVAAPPHERLGGISYWPMGVSIILMLVAVGLTLQTSRRAAKLTHMQADFISHVSHQLKTPLSLLSAATETIALERVRTPEKLMQYVGIIRGEVARLAALVHRILELSRFQQARGYEFELVDLGALVRETVAAFERGLADEHFTFVLEEGAPPPCVMADPAAIEQALVNLLDNAVKYSGSRRQITVRVELAGSRAAITVMDCGIGIPKADYERIFEKFYRGSRSSAQTAGFGLGLSIVQELVQAHRGRVDVASVPGEGSTFRMVIPAVGALQAGHPPAGHPMQAGSEGAMS